MRYGLRSRNAARSASRVSAAPVPALGDPAVTSPDFQASKRRSAPGDDWRFSREKQLEPELEPA
jgi:hypothetical protein